MEKGKTNRSNWTRNLVISYKFSWIYIHASRNALNSLKSRFALFSVLFISVDIASMPTACKTNPPLLLWLKTFHRLRCLMVKLKKKDLYKYLVQSSSSISGAIWLGNQELGQIVPFLIRPVLWKSRPWNAVKHSNHLASFSYIISKQVRLAYKKMKYVYNDVVRLIHIKLVGWLVGIHY